MLKASNYKTFGQFVTLFFLEYVLKFTIHNKSKGCFHCSSSFVKWKQQPKVFFVSGKTSSTFELSFSCLANKNLITYKDFFEHLQALPNQGQKSIFLHQPKNWKINENFWMRSFSENLKISRNSNFELSKNSSNWSEICSA